MAGFKIKIGADTVELSKSLGELQKDLALFKKQLSAATGPQDIVKLNQAIAQTDRAIKSISGAQSIQAIGRDMKELPVGFNLAGNAVGNFSRIVQDAPFSLLSGNLIAVSNNIDPMIQSFVHLKQQTGSTGAALKALGSSLIGSGGLLLGFSLVNAAITFFSARAMFGAKKEMEGFAKAQADANKEAGDQIARLKILTAISQDTTRSIGERSKAAKELSQTLKEYNVQLSQEEILNGRVAEATKIATQAILERAKARAIEARISELSAQNLDRETKRLALAERLIDPQKKLNELQEKNRKANRLDISDIQTANTLNTVNNLKGEIGELDAATNKANAEINSLLSRVVNEDITPKFDSDKTKKDTDLLKERIQALKTLQTEVGLTTAQQIELAQLEIQLASRDAIKLGFTPAELQQRIQGIIDKSFPGERLTSRLRLRVSGDIDSTSVRTAIDRLTADVAGRTLTGINLFGIVPAEINAVIKALQDAAKAKKELLKTDEAKAFADFISNQLGPVFTDLFANIATDGENAFKAFGNAIVNIIKRLIAAAAAAAALATILSAILPGFGGFKAGFKLIFGQLTGLKFADGGITQGPTAGFMAKVHPNEAIIPLSRLSQVIGSQGGGGVGGSFSARIVDGGRDLYLIMERANKTFGRNF